MATDNQPAPPCRPGNSAGRERRFYAQPRVYVVVDRDGCIEGVYETRAAAQVVIDWHRKRGESMRSYDTPVCSLSLAAERFSS